MRKGNLWALLLALVMLMTTPGAYAEESFSMAGYVLPFLEEVFSLWL